VAGLGDYTQDGKENRVAIKIEREHRFRLVNFVRNFVPGTAKATHITQNYLQGSQDAARRIRQAYSPRGGEITYFYTEKRSTAEVGANEEDEKEISAKEYALLSRQIEENTFAVVKMRYEWEHLGQQIELDLFQKPHWCNWLRIVEIETDDLTKPVSLPEEWKVINVTGISIYSNWAIAHGLLRHPV
jgi:CYTH domain-containing protein